MRPVEQNVASAGLATPSAGMVPGLRWPKGIEGLGDKQDMQMEDLDILSHIAVTMNQAWSQYRTRSHSSATRLNKS